MDRLADRKRKIMQWLVLDENNIRRTIPVDNVAYVETALDDKGKPVKGSYSEVHLKTGDVLYGLIREEWELK